MNDEAQPVAIERNADAGGRTRQQSTPSTGGHRPALSARRALFAGFGRPLALIAGLGFVVRVAYVAFVMPHVHLGFDALWYELQAGTIAGGHGFVDPAAFYQHGRSIATAQFPPLWPGLLAVVHLGGGTSAAAYELVGSAAGTVTIVLTGLLGRRLAGPLTGLVAAGAVAASPALVAADGSLMAESVFIALIVAAMLTAYRASEGGRLRSWVLLGLLLGLATLTRSDGLILGPAIVVATLVRRSTTPTRARILRGILVFGVIAVTLTPWVISRSEAMGSTVILSSNSGTLLEGANCRAAYYGPDLGLWEPSCLHYARSPGLSEVSATTHARAAAVHYARQHWMRLPIVAPARVLRTFGLYDPINQSRIEAVESRDAGLQIAAWCTWIVVFALGIGGLILSWRRRADVAPMIGVLVGVVLIAIVGYGSQRYRLPADPVVAVFGALALARAAVRWRRRRVPDNPRDTRGLPRRSTAAAPLSSP